MVNRNDHTAATFRKYFEVWKICQKNALKMKIFEEFSGQQSCPIKAFRITEKTGQNFPFFEKMFCDGVLHPNMSRKTLNIIDNRSKGTI